jgi:hypothetical protein
MLTNTLCIETVPPAVALGFICTVCKKYFKSKKSLSTHRSAYHSDTLASSGGKVCEFCGNQDRNMKRHLGDCEMNPENVQV